MAKFTLTKEQKLNIQIVLSIVMVLAGLTLLFMGFWVNPTGVISNSVLIAFGEILTFVGSVFGIDYKYKERLYLYKQRKGLEDVDEEAPIE